MLWVFDFRRFAGAAAIVGVGRSSTSWRHKRRRSPLRPTRPARRSWTAPASCIFRGTTSSCASSARLSWARPARWGRAAGRGAEAGHQCRCSRQGRLRPRNSLV